MRDCPDEARRLMYAKAGATLAGLAFVGGPPGCGRPLIVPESQADNDNTIQKPARGSWDPNWE
jgi:hypothetical protein